MVTVEQRQNELRLLKEYELAGKIRKINAYTEVETDENDEEEIDEKLRSRQWREQRVELGDGNFRKWNRPKE
jgi:hypothetical protein